MDKKKTVVVYGNCHTSVIIEILNQCRLFNENFEICPIKPVHMIKDPTYFKMKIFSECDIFIHQAIRKNNRYGKEFASEEIIKNLKTGCKVISIPNVYHLPTCFFPQYYEGIELRVNHGKVTVFFRDRIIDECFAAQKSMSSIIEKYNDPEYIDRESQLREFDKFIQKVRSREQEWDIKVSDFILDNYRTHRLFNDPNHPTAFFLKYVAKQIMKILTGDTDDAEIDNMKVSNLDPYEMPVCRCTSNNMLLKYKVEIIRETGQKVRERKMDLKEYVLQYMAMEWANPDLNSSLKFKSRALWVYLKITDIPHQISRIFRYVKRKSDFLRKKER